MDWSKDLTHSQKVFLLKVLAKIQDMFHVQFELVGQLIDELHLGKTRPDISQSEFEMLMGLIGRRNLSDY